MDERAGRRGRIASLVGLLAAATLLVGCPKKHKPPAMTRVWLGEGHACSAIKTGGLACWGDNRAAQLGEGPSGLQPLPRSVSSETPTTLALGGSSTCGTFAGGEVRCWGEGFGARPRAVSGPGSVPLHASALAAADGLVCAIASDTRRVWCWSPADAAPEAKLAPGLEEVEVDAIGAGPTMLCAAAVRPREVRCASIVHGRIGGVRRLLPTMDIATISVGADHACALLRDGSARCWGDNASGQLGDGTTRASNEPALVYGAPELAEIGAGRRHTCARTRLGTVVCWGQNDVYQLSNGTTDPSSKPTLVPGLVGIQELVVAGDSACVRLADGGVRCWGRNAAGQLGDGTTENHPVAMPIKW